MRLIFLLLLWITCHRVVLASGSSKWHCAVQSWCWLTALGCKDNQRALNVTPMPHCHSAAKRAERRQRALDKNFAQEVPSGHKLILVPKAVASRTRKQAQLLE
eukprot:11864336-Karenia_brevis.AAC.1